MPGKYLQPLELNADRRELGADFWTLVAEKTEKKAPLFSKFQVQTDQTVRIPVKPAYCGGTFRAVRES